MLSDEQLLRYNRQILLNDFDVAGQEALLRARVLVVGLGGLGCPAAMYLAAAGVGQLVLADGDQVELSNLQRQIAHGDADIGRAKAESVAATLAALNPGVQVEVVARRLDEAAMNTLAAQVDLVLDSSDNYPTRFALNRACIAAGVPLVSAAAVRAEGQLAVYHPAAGGPCYRCVYPQEGENTAQSCSESGVLAPVVGVLGSLQALEALKLLAGFGEPLRGALLVADLRGQHWQRLAVRPRPGCPDCAHLQD
ncbi:molybdopterin-synthase adenylyltransferase MoeB [Mangrovimicrobium sediminis]|uniref:Molybdopterin-synthase adenylyltransferase n=1 Tax=Mangrovimicrobium sediminis TaxID=2562682 RepID=A0A4Z0LW80_9GAMM|nr:molybdopterin-synthase adenylyltransferase MoeB [Haliea sp. SAOS-164]TGD71541.1 molybdopterin-synthase adenylyltransferase MoeB [Haliea sp. SAOS-164]